MLGGVIEIMKDDGVLANNLIHQAFVKYSEYLFFYVQVIMPIKFGNMLKKRKQDKIKFFNLCLYNDFWRISINDCCEPHNTTEIKVYSDKYVGTLKLKENSIWLDVLNGFRDFLLVQCYTTEKENFVIRVLNKNHMIPCIKISLITKKVIFFNKNIKKAHLNVLLYSIQKIYNFQYF